MLLSLGRRSVQIPLKMHPVALQTRPWTLERDWFKAVKVLLGITKLSDSIERTAFLMSLELLDDLAMV